MWQELWTCMSQRRVALCIPVGGEAVPLVYWYGVLASLGIFLGALYASKHLELEGEDPDIVWDALLWVLIPALVGARLWYVAQAAIAYPGLYSLSRPLEIINPRGGGMNIFGGAVGGLIAVIVYTRTKKIDGWVLADGALLGLLIGQGIGRIGNFINIELYGPPTNSTWFGMLIPMEYRMARFRDLPVDTRFHPTMFYEAFWLFLSFGVLYFIFRRYQERIVHGVLSGVYLIMAGFGRFIVEFWRPDQPRLPGTEISYSRIVAMLYVVLGLIIVLDRTGYLKIPLIERPQTRRERQKAYEEIVKLRRRRARAREREKVRDQRRKERERASRLKESASQQEDSES